MTDKKDHPWIEDTLNGPVEVWPIDLDKVVTFPDWDKKLAERFPNGVPIASTPLMDILKSRQQS